MAQDSAAPRSSRLIGALEAGRYLERAWLQVLVGWALLITVSTVATGNH